MKSAFDLAPDGIYRCDAFSENFTWQTHGFGTRLANPTADVTLRQVHSATVVNAKGLTDRACEGDALITDAVDCNIGIRIADCVPILLLDSNRRAVGAVHAGWRGTAAQIVKRAVEMLGSTFSSDSAHIHAAIGPCIHECCYEVGEEVAQKFSPFFPEWKSTPGKRRLDLPEANRRQLHAAGVDPKHVYDCGRCTACEPDVFFSYRRNPKDPGRMLASIGRRF